MIRIEVNDLVIWQINGNQKLSGGQPPEVFLRAFQVATT